MRVSVKSIMSCLLWSDLNDGHIYTVFCSWFLFIFFLMGWIYGLSRLRDDTNHREPYIRLSR